MDKDTLGRKREQIQMLKFQGIIDKIAFVEGLLAGRPADVLFTGREIGSAPTKILGLKEYELLLADFSLEITEPVPTGIVNEMHDQFLVIKDVLYVLAKVAFAGNLETLSERELAEAPRAQKACREILEFYDNLLKEVILAMGGTSADFSEFHIPNEGFNRAAAEMSFQRLEDALNKH